MSDPTLMSAAEQARLVRERHVSAHELTQAHLARIDRLDPAIGAFLLVDREAALTTAAHIDETMARGHDPGPLAGVPMALKDILVTRDCATTAGSRILADWIPPYDGTVVARLRAAGAVLLGKLNLDEFAMGSSNENSAFKPCRNPWHLERVPGGSSGGSAAAVAAHLCAVSLGTDTGGSIRQPASFCGIVGLKPTYGRVSRYGVIAFASSLDQVGPMARTVEDAALLLEVIAGFDARDATSIDAPVPRYRDALGQGVSRVRIGLPEEFFAVDMDAEVRAAVERATDVFRALGAELVPVSLPHTEYALPTYYLIAPAEASSNLARYDGVRYGLRARDAQANSDLMAMYELSRGQGFGAEVKRRIMLGTFALRSGYYDAYYRKAQQVRTLIKRDFERAFEDVDLILAPTAPTPAFALGDKSSSIDMYLADIFTLSCNLAGLPGMNVPCGFSAAGLPIGMQLIGKPLAEAELLAAAAAYEREVGALGPGGVPVRRPEVIHEADHEIAPEVAHES